MTRTRVAGLQEWLQDDKNAAIAAAFSAQELPLLLFFSGVPLPAAAHATLLQPVSNLMQLVPDSGSDQLMLVRLVAHLAAVVLRASPALPAGRAGADPAALYRCLALTVERMVGSHLPAMPEDMQSMAIRVLGGRWYKCPNGHSYYVDACGRPTEILKCATCGVDIGGLSHDLLKTNVDVDDSIKNNTGYNVRSAAVDKSEHGYCLREANAENAEGTLSDTVRSMQPVATRTQRFLLHASMLLGCLVAGEEWCGLAALKGGKGLFNATYVAMDPGDVPGFLCDHVVADLRTLRLLVRRSEDDISTLLHEVLRVMTPSCQPQGAPLDAVVPPGPPRMRRQPRDAELMQQQQPQQQQQQQQIGHQQRQGGGVQMNLEERVAWESSTSQLIVPLLVADGVAERAEAARERTSTEKNDEASGALMIELSERTNVASMELIIRQASAPCLWRYRHVFRVRVRSREREQG